MFDKLPKGYQDFQAWNWDEIGPYADSLLEEEVTANSLASWMERWTRLYNLIAECHHRLMIRNTTHTDDEKNTQRYHEYGEKVMPEAEKFEKAMIDKLLESGLEPEHCVVPLRKMGSRAHLFHEANLSVIAEIERLVSEKQAIESRRTFEWDGEQLTIKQVFDKLQQPDREVRERAYRALIEKMADDEEEIDRIWVQLLELRQQLAENAGFSDFRAYQWQKLGRFDYQPKDCKAFQQAILECVVPVAARLGRRRKERLGLETLRDWDDHWSLKPDLSGRPPLKPFRTIAELHQGMERIFKKIDPDFGGYYHTMVTEGLLDIETRKNKVMIGYMEELPASKRPFVVTNATTSAADINTLLHEGGHCFHLFECAHWPFHYQYSLDQIPMEFVEVPSMAMELLAYPYLTADQGGFYTEKEAARAKITHLESIMSLLAYVAVADAFQHWVYENPQEAIIPSKCGQAWAELYQRYFPQLDWNGVEGLLPVLRYETGHIFFQPFYMVEYGFAQLGAIQIWANSQGDYRKALQGYRAALALGNTATLPELYQAAGATFAFDRETISGAIEMVENTLQELGNLV